MRWTWPRVWEGERGGEWRVPVTMILWCGGLILGLFLTTEVMIGLRGVLKSEPEYVKDIVGKLVGAPTQLGLALAGCLIGVRFVHGKAVASVLTDGRPFRLALAFQSGVLWILLWFLGTICLPDGWEHLRARAGEVPPAGWLVLAGVTFCAISLQATEEEIVFRGYLLTRVAAWVKRPWLAIGIVTVIFTAIHFHSSSAAKAAIALFAIIMGAACIRSGTLSPLIGMHAAHNALQSLWYPKGTNASATWPEATVWAVQLVIWFGWLLWVTSGPCTQPLQCADHDRDGSDPHSVQPGPPCSAEEAADRRTA